MGQDPPWEVSEGSDGTARLLRWPLVAWPVCAGEAPSEHGGGVWSSALGIINLGRREGREWAWPAPGGAQPGGRQPLWALSCRPDVPSAAWAWGVLVWNVPTLALLVSVHQLRLPGKGVAGAGPLSTWSGWRSFPPSPVCPPIPGPSPRCPAPAMEPPARALGCLAAPHSPRPRLD